MEEFEDQFPGALIDRLVDGEMAPDEQRQVLISLESEKDGWRRCALAFLESKAWSKHLGVFVNDAEDKLDKLSTVQKTRPSGTASHVNRIGWWFATAACAVMAFSLGVNSQPKTAVITPDVNRIAYSESDATPTLPSAPTGQRYQPDFWERGSSMPNGLVRLLRDHGVEVKTVRGLTHGINQQGDPILVPYEDVRLQPVRSTAY